MASMRAIRVLNGDLVNPFDCTHEELGRVDFVHSLSQLNRFTGHVKYPYSVMQHSIVLYHHVPAYLRPAALIHDFGEAFFNDVASPIKAKYMGYKRDEKNLLHQIAEVFDVSVALIEEVSVYDKRLYRDESINLHVNIRERGNGDDREPLGVGHHWFRERLWRNVRQEGWGLMQVEFGRTGASVF